MTTYLLLMTFTAALVTFLLRAFPFFAFGRGNKAPDVIAETGRFISPAAIAMLIVYCFSAAFDDVSFTEKYYGAAEWIAAVVVILLHWKWKNPLLSILVGTAIYMILLQKVF